MEVTCCIGYMLFGRPGHVSKQVLLVSGFTNTLQVDEGLPHACRYKKHLASLKKVTWIPG